MTPAQIEEMRAIRWFHRIQLGNQMTPGQCPHTAAEATSRFGLPESLAGQTVLDIGAWDGLFSFEAERRGATVTAMDITVGGHWGGTAGFEFAHRYLNSRVTYREGNVFELDPAVHGTFDYVFFFGVLYHVKDPLEALRRVLAVTRECCLIETACAVHPDALSRPIWELKPGYDNDPTNYWYPTLAGLAAALKMLGCADANLVQAIPGRMTVRAFPTQAAADRANAAGG